MKRSNIFILTVCLAGLLPACRSFVVVGGGHDRHHPGRPWNWRPHVENVQPTDPTVQQQKYTKEQAAEAVAQEYDIKRQSAQKIVEFAQEKDKDQAAQELGVTAQEMAPILRQEMPSQETVQKISEQLQEQDSTINQLFFDFVTDQEELNQ